MAEITKINIKGVDYDIGGTGGGSAKTTVEFAIQGNETGVFLTDLVLFATDTSITDLENTIVRLNDGDDFFDLEHFKGNFFRSKQPLESEGGKYAFGWFMQLEGYNVIVLVFGNQNSIYVNKIVEMTNLETFEFEVLYHAIEQDMISVFEALDGQGTTTIKMHTCDYGVDDKVKLAHCCSLVYALVAFVRYDLIIASNSEQNKIGGQIIQTTVATTTE